MGAIPILLLLRGSNEVGSIVMIDKNDTTSKIKAIETEYNGYRFRSRLEARWAVFFDTINLKYEYEKEGYDLGDTIGFYLPDFWFPDLKLHCEIKPIESSINLKLYQRFRDNITNIILIQGTPWEYIATWFGWDLNDSSGGPSEFNAAIVSLAMPKDNDIPQPLIIIEDRRSDRIYGLNEMFEPSPRTYNFSSFDYIKSHKDLCTCLNSIAILRSKRARFEHGESQ